jgi:hypothetical protein
VGLAGPTYRLTSPLSPPSSLSFIHQFSTTLMIASTPFFQVCLIRGLSVTEPSKL